MTNKKTHTGTKLAVHDLKTSGRLVLVWLAISWERLWSRLWIPTTFSGLFIAITLTDVLPSLAFILHVFLVLATLGAIGYLTYRALREFKWPTRKEARNRLEKTSPVLHRPLTTIEDSLAGNASVLQKNIWKLHQRRAENDIYQLQATAPSPGIAKQDRFDLRFGQKY